MLELRGDSQPQLHRQHILILDDDEDTCLLFQLVLELEGAEVTIAYSVAQATQVLLERKVDVLISDIALPDQDGCAFLSGLRRQEQDQNQSILAIAVTAMSGAALQQRTLAAGFNRYLLKPVDIAELVKAVVELTRSKA